MAAGSLAGICSGSGCAGAGGQEGPAGAALCPQVQLEDRNQEVLQPGDPQEEMGELPGSRTDFPARMALSEEEKLKVKLWELEGTELRWPLDPQREIWGEFLLLGGLCCAQTSPWPQNPSMAFTAFVSPRFPKTSWICRSRQTG